MLRHNRGLVSLDLRANRLGKHGLLAIAEGVQVSSWRLALFLQCISKRRSICPCIDMVKHQCCKTMPLVKHDMQAQSLTNFMVSGNFDRYLLLVCSAMLLCAP